MPRGTLEVIDFDPSRMIPASVSSLPSTLDADTRLDFLSHLRLRYRAETSVLAALFVLALHTVVLLPALRGAWAPPDPHHLGSPNAIRAELIDDRSANMITPPALSPPSLRSVTLNLPEMPNRRSTDSGLAALYGRYLGQIHARIDRTWLMPRTAIGADLFRCRVEIWQRRDGAIQTVTLQDCNGSVRWQQSLVKAIREASPLPAPPDPAVFAHTIVLHFLAAEFSPGQRPDHYESVRPALNADTEPSPMPPRIRSLQRAFTGRQAPSAIELRISGSHVEVKPITKVRSRTLIDIR